MGDEDQGIYRWRGADLDNILEFEKTFPGAAIRKLERNYRSTQTILDVSGALIANNVNRRGKTLWTDSGAGAKVELYKASDEGDEARWSSTSSSSPARPATSSARWAVLVRTNAQTRAIEDELLKREIPYSLVGGTRFYDRAEIKDLVAYLRVLRNPRDNFSLLARSSTSRRAASASPPWSCCATAPPSSASRSGTSSISTTSAACRRAAPPPCASSAT